MKPPSPTQMRVLQLLRNGHMTWQAASPGLYKIDIEVDPASKVSRPLTVISEVIREPTAKIIVELGWVEMKRFSPRGGEYHLSAKGKELSEQLCMCPGKRISGKGGRRGVELALASGVDPLTTNHKINWPKERLLCMKCWRRARCEAKFFKHPHGANRYIWGVGPICQFHVDNPTKR